MFFLLFSIATAIRLGALVESTSTKSSNKALLFKDINFMVIYSLKYLEKTIIIININLKYIKNKEKNGKP